MTENLQFKINTDTGQSEKAFDKLTEKLDKLADAIGQMSESTDEGFSEVKEAIEEVDKSVDSLQETFDTFKETSTGLIDEVVPGFSSFTRGLGGATKGMSSLNAVFKASPIGLLVAALAAVVGYFTSTQAGAEKLKVIMASVDAVFRVFLESVVYPLGEAIVGIFQNPMESINAFVDKVKNYVIGSFNTLMEGAGLLGSAIGKLFSGDFSGAWEDATTGAAKFTEGLVKLTPIGAIASAAIEGVNAVVEAAPALWEKASKAMSSAARAQERINYLVEAHRVASNKNAVEQERLNAVIAKAEDILGRQFATYEQRTEALESRTQATRDQIAANTDLVNMEIERIQLALSIEKNYETRHELEQELAEATAERIALSTELIELEADAAEEQKRLDFEELERRTDILDTIRTREAQAMSERLADREAAELNEADVDYKNDLVRLERLQATEEEINRLTEAYNAQRLRIQTEYGKERAEKSLSLARTLMDLESELLGESVESELKRRQLDLDMAERDAMLELVELEATEEQKEQVREYYRQLRIKAEKDANKELRQLRMEELAQTIDDSFSAGADLLSAIQDFNSDREAETEEAARRQFEINKKISQAQVLISTAQGIMGQLAVPQDQLTGMNFVKAAVIATAGALQLKTIKATKFDGGGFGEPDFGYSGGGTPAIDLSFLQRDQEQTQIRAYVVGQDLANQAMIREQIKNQANL